MRNVILHYHVFKNAGSSIDNSLADSFGSGWRMYDMDPLWTNVTTSDLLDLLNADQGLKAVSSHQARWPAPATAGIAVFPVVFLRHPIDRIGSIYSYGTRVGEPAAVGRSFSQYVDWLLGSDGTIVGRSFQTLFLSDDDQLQATSERPLTVANSEHLAEALRRLDGLEAFGLVERFSESVDAFRQWLTPTFPELILTPHHTNASPDRASSLKERVDAIVEELGRRRMRRLVSANEADFELWSHATARFEVRFGR